MKSLAKILMAVGASGILGCSAAPSTTNAEQQTNQILSTTPVSEAADPAAEELSTSVAGDHGLNASHVISCDATEIATMLSAIEQGGVDQGRLMEDVASDAGPGAEHPKHHRGERRGEHAAALPASDAGIMPGAGVEGHGKAHHRGGHGGGELHGIRRLIAAYDLDGVSGLSDDERAALVVDLAGCCAAKDSNADGQLDRPELMAARQSFIEAKATALGIDVSDGLDATERATLDQARKTAMEQEAQALGINLSDGLDATEKAALEQARDARFKERLQTCAASASPAVQ